MSKKTYLTNGYFSNENASYLNNNTQFKNTSIINSNRINYKKNLNLDNINYNYHTRNFLGSNRIKNNNKIPLNKNEEIYSEDIVNKKGIYNIKYINDKKNETIEHENNEIILKTFRALYSTDNKKKTSRRIIYNNAKPKINYNIKFYEEEKSTKKKEKESQNKESNGIKDNSNENKKKALYRGGYREFNTKRIIITSNEKIESWYKGEWYRENQKKALYRRIDVYDYFMLIGTDTVRTDLLIDF